MGNCRATRAGRPRSGHMRAAAACALMLAAAGCGDNPAKYNALQGLDPQLSATDITAYATRQKTIVRSLVTLAFSENTPIPATGDPNWYVVALAGANYVDQKCDSYLNALFWFNRWRGSAKNGVALTGAATAAAMGVLRSSIQALSLTATAFGLVTGLIDTGADTVLYGIDPTALRIVLKKAQGVYRDGMAAKRKDYTDETGAMLAVQGYLGLCLPAGLEALVNNAVATTNITPGAAAAGNPVPLLNINGSSQPAPAAAPPPPHVIAPGVTSLLSPDLAAKKNAVEKFVRVLTLNVASGNSPKSDLDNVANALGVPISDSPGRERDVILAVLQSSVNTPDKNLAELQLSELIAKLNKAGIQF